MRILCLKERSFRTVVRRWPDTTTLILLLLYDMKIILPYLHENRIGARYFENALKDEIFHYLRRSSVLETNFKCFQMA